MFVFGDFNVHHKDILVELIDLVNSVIDFTSNDLTQIFNFPTKIPDYDYHSPCLLNLFFPSDASIRCPMAIPPLVNSDHVVSISIEFPITSKQDALFHCLAYDHSRADWDSLCDHLRDIPWEDIFKLSASAAVCEFCELVQVGFDVDIPHRKYQVKPHSSPWCLPTCDAAIVHRNLLSYLYQQNKSSESKVKFRQASICCKRVFEAAKLAHANKTKVHHFLETWLSVLLVNYY